MLRHAAKTGLFVQPSPNPQQCLVAMLRTEKPADEADDNFPTLEELLHRPLRSQVSIVEPADPHRPQYLDQRTLDASSSVPYDRIQTRLGNRRGDSQGKLVTGPSL
jgi:hypothetical protein